VQEGKTCALYLDWLVDWIWDIEITLIDVDYKVVVTDIRILIHPKADCDYQQSISKSAIG